MLRARVATEMTKKGLRSGPNSANEAEQLGSDRTPEKTNKLQTNTTCSVRDALEGGGNTSPQEVGICATMTSQ